MIPNIESKVFNGLVFKTNLVKTEHDENRSNWKSNNLNYDYTMRPFKHPNINGYTLPNDYKIIFHESNIKESLADTLGQRERDIVKSIPINLQIWNTTQDKEIDFSAIKYSDQGFSQLTIWLHEDNLSQNKRTWHIGIYSYSNTDFLGISDTLYLFT